MIKNEVYTLYNGVQIPKVGFGTWQITDKEQCINSTLWALEAGYRHIDTAAAYQNEQFIKEALAKTTIPRNEIFITSKLHAEKKGYQVALDEFHKTIERLGVDYLDLYLIHAPKPWGDTSGFDYMPLNIESWKAMEELYKQGKIRSIGVSNFNVDQLKQLISATSIKPMVNQIKMHIGYPNQEIMAFCQKNDILVEAYSPNATGRLSQKEAVKAMADTYNVSVSQLGNRWCLEHNTLPLPKSVHKEWIEENIALDFVIKPVDFKALNEM